MVYAIAVVACFGLAGYAGFKATVRTPTPARDVFGPDRTVHHFGEVNPGDELTTSFLLSNTFGRPVEITNVMKGCTCAEAELASRTVPAGGDTRLRVRWNTSGRRGPSNERVLLLYTVVGGGSGVIEVRVQADVVPVFDCVPGELTFDPDTVAEVQVVCRPRCGGLRVTGVTTDHSHLHPSVEPGGAGVRVRYAPVPGLPPGDRLATVTVLTDSEKEPRFSIPVRFRK